MNSATHTPGPWTAENGNRYCGFAISAHGTRGGRLLIAETIGLDPIPLPRNRYREGPITVANANLIAAAPDLLEACEMLFETCEEEGTQSRERAKAACAAAIAKARTPVGAS